MAVKSVVPYAICIWAVLLVLILLPAPAQAQTITMSNPAGIAERDILVYDSTGQLQGFYNSTSVITINGSQDYVFMMKPVRTNPLEDPGDWMNSAFSFVASNITALIALMFVAGVFGAALSRR